ncbi:MAG: hypothetical protein JXQ90_02465 [Cyclobacteriaceae bacterium]
MRIIVLLALILVSQNLIAQAPEWVDPVIRDSKWSNELYLTAFASEVVTKKESQTEMQSQLYQIVKGQLSDQIMVSVNAQSELRISIENTKTDQSMTRNSLSVSDANLVGLKLENYYDKKKKILYAFAYVAIEELSRFNQQLIEKNTTQIDQNLNRLSGDKTSAIAACVDNKRLFSEIEKSIKLLNALDQPNPANVDALKEKANRNNQAFRNLFNSGVVTINNIVSATSGLLLHQLAEGSNTVVKRGIIQYSNSGVSSELMDEIQNQLTTSLSADNRLTIGDAGGELNGQFSLADNLLSLSLNIVDQGAVVSSTNLEILASTIQANGLMMLPQNFDLIPKLSSITITGEAGVMIKPSDFVNQPLTYQVKVDNQPVGNLDLSITIEKESKAEVYDVKTDKLGVAKFNLNDEMVLAGEDYLVRAAINLAGYLNIKPGSPFIADLQSANTLPELRTELMVVAPAIYIASKEEGIESALKIKVIEPAVKSSLAGLRYSFVDTEDAADLILTIEAIARKGQVGEIATLTFVDATVSMINRSSGKEIYKNSFFNVKGLGASHDDAQSKAFQKARDMIADDVSYELEYNR